MIAPIDSAEIDGRLRRKSEWRPPGPKVYVDQARGELSLRGRTPWDWQKIISGLKSKDAVDYEGDQLIRMQNEELRKQNEQLHEALQQQKTLSEKLEATLHEIRNSEADYKERVFKLEHHVKQLEIEKQDNVDLLRSQVARHEEEILHLRMSRQSWEKSIKDSLALEHYMMERTIRQLTMEKEMRSREMTNLKETVTRAHADRDAWRKERNAFVLETHGLWRKLDALKAVNEQLSKSSARCDVCSAAQVAPVEPAQSASVVIAPRSESSTIPPIVSARDSIKGPERLNSIPERTTTNDETDSDTDI
mmetsp:Transcript_14826/g.25331  ORF Transcript_14826/g.25331 Transcript_14826/m.25331 type:complete len:306 (-) Transcript_14826:352-1269(-)